MTEKKKEKILMPRKPPPCRATQAYLEVHSAGKTPQYYDALPRDCKFAYLTPGYYATGFRISDVYKTEVDFSEYRNLLFFEDSKLADKWGLLKQRIPYPEGRITDLPGTRELHYKNYCLRSLTAESARSWRKSIKPIPVPGDIYIQEENSPEPEPEPDPETETSPEPKPCQPTPEPNTVENP